MTRTTTIITKSNTVLLDIAAIVTAGDQIELISCPNPNVPGTFGNFERPIDVRTYKGQYAVTLRIRKDRGPCLYEVIANGKRMYKGYKIPFKHVTFRKGIAGKLNRFIGKVMFKMSDEELDIWAGQCARAAARDGLRHARMMA